MFKIERDACYTTEDLAGLFGITPESFRNRMSKIGGLPKMKFGGGNLYLGECVIKWLKGLSASSLSPVNAGNNFEKPMIKIEDF